MASKTQPQIDLTIPPEDGDSPDKPPAYDSKRHRRMLKTVGLVEEFDAAWRGLVAREGMKQRGAQHKAFCVIWPKYLKVRPPERRPRAPTKVKNILDGKKALRPVNVAWAIDAYGMLEAGVIPDPATAPSYEALAIFALAKLNPRDVLGPYLKVSAESGDGSGTDENEDDAQIGKLDAMLGELVEGSKEQD